MACFSTRVRAVQEDCEGTCGYIYPAIFPTVMFGGPVQYHREESREVCERKLRGIFSFFLLDGE